MDIYFEKLRISDFLVFLLHRFARRFGPGSSSNIYYFEASRRFLFFVRLFSWTGKFKFIKMDFKFVDVKDKNSTVSGLQVIYKDLAEYFGMVTEGEAFNAIAAQVSDSHLLAYIKKNISSTLPNPIAFESTPLRHTLFMIQVVRWHLQENRRNNGVLYIQRRCWMDVLSQYARNKNVLIIGTHRDIDLKKRFTKFFRRFAAAKYLAGFAKLLLRNRKALRHINRTENTQVKIAIETINNFNFFKPSYFSDAFFLQKSAIEPGNVLLYASGFPITDEQYAETQKLKYGTLALTAHKIQNSNVPVFLKNISTAKPLPVKSRPKMFRFDYDFFNEQVFEFETIKKYWLELFKTFNVKAHISQFKWDGRHICIDAALQELGGASAIWQISYEEFSSPALAISADLVFGFSTHNAVVEQENGSNINYHITVGYPGDYRFELLKGKADKIRTRLLASGAKKIVAFFDENSSPDERWTIGNSAICEEYRFFLEKVIEEPWLGVVFKPKKPNTLFERLSAIHGILRRALETGRCYIFEADANKIPPAAAALTADLSIHCAVWSATAGLESALTGTPTFLMDFAGWHKSQLYELGEGKVVFKNWTDLWNAVVKYFAAGHEGCDLGNWNPVISDLDPFRDGCAADRIGTYMQWIIAGYEKGGRKENILEDAAEKYCLKWGHDKVRAVC